MSPTSNTCMSAEATKGAAAVPAVDARRSDDTLSDSSNTTPLLEVTDLKVSLPSEGGRVNVVRRVNLSVVHGEVLALVGESGLNKFVILTAVMGLFGESAEITGSVRLHSTELLGRSDGYMSRIRGSQVVMVFQNPLNTLAPVHIVGAQIAEAPRVHQPGMSKADAHGHVVKLLDLVGILNPQVCARAYPHGFSGGIRRRTTITTAIANDPDFTIADKPTTTLDVIIQVQILDALRTAQKETGAGIIMITHDLGAMTGMTDRVATMYVERVVETGDVDDVFYRSRMSYTIGLLSSLPRLDARKGSALVTLEGDPPSLLELPRGCPFIPRCPMAQAECAQGEPELTLVEREGTGGQETGSGAQYSVCHRHDEIKRDQLNYSHIYPVPAPKTPETMNLPHTECPEVLRVTDLVREFLLMKSAVFKRRVGTVHAVDGVSFNVRWDETLALIGESRYGRATTLMEVLSPQGPQEGTIMVPGKDTADLGRVQRRQVRRDLQIVFWDPTAPLDPRLPIPDIIAESLQANGQKKTGIGPRVGKFMELVGLESSHANCYPHDFSGEQRQRIGTAHTLVLEPSLLVLDEPVFALDVSIQVGVVNLFDELRATMGLSHLFVAHDLSAVRHIADCVAVMYLGRIVEIGDVGTIFEALAHPYTQTLLSTIPIPDPAKKRNRSRIVLEGDMPDPASLSSGCRFRTRCPKLASGLIGGEHSACLGAMPESRSQDEDHDVAYYYPERTVVSWGLSLPSPPIALSVDPAHRPCPPPYADGGALSERRFPRSSTVVCSLPRRPPRPSWPP